MSFDTLKKENISFDMLKEDVKSNKIRKLYLFFRA